MTATGRFGVAVLAATVVAISGHWREARASLVYVSVNANNVGSYSNQLETIDTTTGVVNVISTGGSAYSGLQFVNGQLYGEGTSDGHLYQINATTGTATDLGVISTPGSSAQNQTFSGGPNGVTYGFDGVNSEIYLFTPPSTSAQSTGLQLVSYFPVHAVGPDGRIYGLIANASNNYSTFRQLDFLDSATGNISYGPELSNGGLDPNNFTALFFDGSTLYALQSGGGLYTIDTTTGQVNQPVTLSSAVGYGGGYGVAAAVMPSTSAVPEPASLTLCGAAGAAIALAGGWRRHRLASRSRSGV